MTSRPPSVPLAEPQPQKDPATRTIMSVKARYQGGVGL